MTNFFEIVFSFPVAVFFIPYCIFLGLMIISLITGFLDDLHFPLLGGVDVDLDADGDMFSNHGHFGDNFLLPIAMTKVPLPIALTITFFIASLLSYVCELTVRAMIHLLPDFLYLPLIVILLVLCLWLSLHIAAFILKPFLPIFDKTNTLAIVQYEGKIGVVKTMVVTSYSGDVEITEGSLDNHIDVYTEEPEGTLRYGDTVLLVLFNKEKERYLVMKHRV